MKFFKRIFNSTSSKGSTLLSVMVVTTILSLMMITLQPIMFSYAKRSIEERDFKQADFSARSANDAIVSGILEGDVTLITGIKGIASDGASLVLDNFSFSKTGMGNVEAKVLRISDIKFSVITRATCNGVQRTIAREINRVITGGGAAPAALPGFYVSSVNYNGGGYNLTANSSFAVGLTYSIAGGSNMNFGGDFIVLPGATQSMGGSSHMQVAGNIYTPNASFSLGGSSILTLRGKAYYKNNSPLTSLVATNNIRYSAYVLQTTQALINSYTAVPDWVRYSGNTYSPTIQLQGGQYYAATGSNTVADINVRLSTSVTTSRPVFIIVKNNSTFTVSSSIGSPGQPAKVFFILEGNAQLTVASGSSVVVYGSDTSVMNVNNPNFNTSDIYGQIRVGQLLHVSNTNQIILQYVAATGGGTEVENWTAGLYTKASY